jgi:hypothetical protein
VVFENSTLYSGAELHSQIAAMMALAHRGFPKLRLGVRGVDIAVENLFRSGHDE